VIAGHAAVINALMWFKPQVIDVKLEAFRWVAMAMMLPCFAVVCGRVSEMRQRLRRTNEELSAALGTIQKMATHDTLTGLPNRALFNESLAHAISLAARHRRGLALFYVDLDRFKYINETIGHSQGDRVLQEAARRITASSCSSFTRRMSLTAARTSRICVGAETPVRTLARTALSQRMARASHSLSEPTGVSSTSWLASSSGMRASSSPIEYASSKPNASLAASGP